MPQKSISFSVIEYEIPFIVSSNLTNSPFLADITERGGSFNRLGFVLSTPLVVLTDCTVREADFKGLVSAFPVILISINT